VLSRNSRFLLHLCFAAGVVSAILASGAGRAAEPANRYPSWRWRMIGPFRGGRITSLAGVPGQQNVYYFGTPGGGVWKSTDAGHVWQPIFDRQPVAGVGAIAVAP